MLTETDIDLLEKHFRAIFATKDELQQVKSDIMGVLDTILKEVATTRKSVRCLIDTLNPFCLN